MGSVLILAFLVGLDNFLVTTGLGVSGLKQRQKWLLVASFAFFETCMPLLGLYLGRAFTENLTLFTQYAGPVSLAFCGLLLLFSLRLGPRSLQTWQRILPLLPLLLSFDNLLAGVGFGALNFPVATTALVVGGCSGLMCLAGVALGEKLGSRIPVRAEALGGAWLLTVAVVLVF